MESRPPAKHTNYLIYFYNFLLNLIPYSQTLTFKAKKLITFKFVGKKNLHVKMNYIKLYGIKLLKIFPSYRIKRALRFLPSAIKCCSESQPDATE